MDGLLAAATGRDLHDQDRFASAADKLLTALDTGRTTLRALADATAENPDLVGPCEHYDILDSLVLHDNPGGWRLRLHVFVPGYFDRPHNHRWSYTSRIHTATLWSSAFLPAVAG